MFSHEFKIILVILGVILIFQFYNKNSIEKMSNGTTPEDIRQIVKDVYKADVVALKNIGDVAASLLSADKKKLTLPFDEVEISGKLNMKGDITIPGDFVIPGNLNVKGDINMEAGKSIRGKGRLHLASEERMYLLPKQGVWLTKDWGSDANLHVDNDIKVPNLYTENIGKHKGDGWLRINNIGNASSTAIYGTVSINEHKGKGGLNIGSWNEAGVGNGNLIAINHVLVGTDKFPAEGSKMIEGINPILLAKNGSIFGHAMRARYSIITATGVFPHSRVPTISYK